MAQLLWILLVIFLIIDLLVTALRVGLLNVRATYLVTLRDQDPAAVEESIALLKKPRVRISLHLWSVLFHFLLVGTGSWLFVLLMGGFPGVWAAVGLLALAAVLVLTLEFCIEGWVLPNAEKLAISTLLPVKALDTIASPISSLLMVLLGSKKMLANRMSVMTEDELRTWVQEGQPEGSLEQGEREMIYSIFQFGDTLAREVMVPRMDVLSLDMNIPLEQAVQALRQSGHSRVPVYENEIEHIIGLLYAKDLVGVEVEGQSLESFRTRLRPAYFVPETKKVDELLREMQARSVHMAIVVDEYGGIAGLVTLEDIMEEIVGEIRDEYDQSEELLYEQAGLNEFIFQGRIDLDDFNEVMGSHLQKDAADTLGGFIFSQIGHVPEVGEQVEVGNLVLTVEQISGRRIRSVRALTKPTTHEKEEGSTEKEDEIER